MLHQYDSSSQGDRLKGALNTTLKLTQAHTAGAKDPGFDEAHRLKVTGLHCRLPEKRPPEPSSKRLSSRANSGEP